jgi:hypothetical protein
MVMQPPDISWMESPLVLAFSATAVSAGECRHQGFGDEDGRGEFLLRMRLVIGLATRFQAGDVRQVMMRDMRNSDPVAAEKGARELLDFGQRLSVGLAECRKVCLRPGRKPGYEIGTAHLCSPYLGRLMPPWHLAVITGAPISPQAMTSAVYDGIASLS